MPRKGLFLQDFEPCYCFRTPVNFQLTDIFVFVGEIYQLVLWLNGKELAPQLQPIIVEI